MLKPPSAERHSALGSTVFLLAWSFIARQRETATFVRVLTAFSLLLLVPRGTQAASLCDADGVQASGSKYRICLPDAADYNGMLVIWAHGYQDAAAPVNIPEEQLCFGLGVCLPELLNDMGFGFATNSYSKTGLAVLQGKADILDLVDIYAKRRGKPTKVYLIGASEGGLITALSLEQRPDVYSAGLAACAPIGDFPAQINYLFGDPRATFQYFFPGLIPGDPFHPDRGLISIWPFYYALVVAPVVFDPANATRLNEWARVANLQVDAGDYINSLKTSVLGVLHYAVVNLNDAAETLGGFPFDNTRRWYSGSSNDLLLNALVPRVAASATATAAMARNYNTSGVLRRPLITLHTIRDQQVPYWHEQLYDLKTLASGAYLTRHVNTPIDRFGHCAFTVSEALASFFIMLAYDSQLPQVSGLGTVLTDAEMETFENRVRGAGVSYTAAGDKLRLTLRHRE
jgi:pimeloyl-ACP methyl ester carboxylesterase